MRIFRFVTAVFLAAMLAPSALADPPPGFEYKTVVSLGAGTDLCNHLWGAFLQSWNSNYLGYGPGDKVTEPQRGQRDYLPRLKGSKTYTPVWAPVPWWDFRDVFPQRYLELTRAGKMSPQDYNIRRMRLDLDLDNHREDFYQILWMNGERFGQIFTPDEKSSLGQALMALQPNYIVGYKNVYYPITREKGMATVWSLMSDHAKHNGAGPQIITSKMCEFRANTSIESTDTGTITTPTPLGGAIYK